MLLQRPREGYQTPRQHSWKMERRLMEGQGAMGHVHWQGMKERAEVTPTGQVMAVASFLQGSRHGSREQPERSELAWV